MDQSIDGGFAEPVFAAQRVFHAVMEALARPGRPQHFVADAAPPAPLTPGLGALALTLCDHDTPLWCDSALAGSAAVAGWLGFQCGTPFTGEPGAAAFALASDMALLPPLEAFAQGSDEYPDRSTTLLLAAPDTTGRYRLRGPGIEGVIEAALPLPGGDFLVQWASNRARFPRGVDLLLVGDGVVIGLPRSCRIEEA